MNVVVECAIVPDHSHEDIIKELSRICGYTVTAYNIIRRSLDARNNAVYYYRCSVELPESVAEKMLRDGKALPFKEEEPAVTPSVKSSVRIPIVGSGPAGLFCACTLIKAGIGVDIYERGAAVENRHGDVAKLRETGILHPDSNIVFGEGGAGTYSDGKLTTRINKKEVRLFYELMMQFGAPSSIAYDSKPHIGTDKLIPIIENIRQHILSNNGTVSFDKKLTDIHYYENELKAMYFNDNMEIATPMAVLATGHSARDVYRMLFRKGIALEKKGFAAGVRIEHPRTLIDEIQYGRRKHTLTAADYKLTWKDKSGRGVYSFCMCPGGYIINSSSEQERLCVNGMSYSARDGGYSNAALVVTVYPDDFDGILGGIDFQISLEEAAYRAGGGGFSAPAQRVTSFLKNSIDSSLPACTYKPNVSAYNINEILPEIIKAPLKRAVMKFNERMKGFTSDEGVIVGAETRTSSPIRILRDGGYQSINCRGLYPIGEGAGYSGGIVSSAVDGIRAAFAILSCLEKEEGHGSS